jgi:hypothetical protein
MRQELEYLVFVRNLITMGGIDDNNSYSSLNKTYKRWAMFTQEKM